MRRLLSGLVCAAVAVAAAGCGSTASNAHSPDRTTTAGSSAPIVATDGSAVASYEKRMQSLGGELSSSIHAAATAEGLVAKDTDAAAKDAKSLQQLQVALRRAAERLSEIHPPPRAGAAHELLRHGVLEYAAELSQVVAKLRGGTKPATALASIRTLRGVRDMERASQEITAEGYNIIG